MGNSNSPPKIFVNHSKDDEEDDPIIKNKPPNAPLVKISNTIMPNFTDMNTFFQTNIENKSNKNVVVFNSSDNNSKICIMYEDSKILEIYTSSKNDQVKEHKILYPCEILGFNDLVKNFETEINITNLNKILNYIKKSTNTNNILTANDVNFDVVGGNKRRNQTKNKKNKKQKKRTKKR